VTFLAVNIREKRNIVWIGGGEERRGGERKGTEGPRRKSNSTYG